MKCQKIKKINDPFGYSYKEQCTKEGIYLVNGVHLCRHHARKGRYVVRNGDIGEILERFDTEDELRANIHKYPGMRMQYLNGSRRTDLI